MKEGQWFWRFLWYRPAPVLLPMPSTSKALKCNKVTRLCVFLGLIFLWDEHPHRACASASLESFHWKRPLSIIMASLGRAISEWRGFYFDNSLWAVWSSHERKYSTTFQTSKSCFKIGFFPLFLKKKKKKNITSSKGSVGGFFNQETCTQARYY